MLTDPSQSTPIESSDSETAAELAEIAESYRREMFGSAGTTPGGGSEVDPRPFGIGYREFPITRLPARDAEPQGEVRRSAPAPNSSFFTHWQSIDDRIVWQVEVVTSGTYRVSLDYTCAARDVGSTICLAFDSSDPNDGAAPIENKSSKLEGTVTPAWDPPFYDNQDTLPRTHGESPLKPFRTLELGTMSLNAGTGSLTLSALVIPGESVMDLRRITLELID